MGTKFIVLLQEEYPTENESQLVQRLVGMWEEHQKNRLYGLRCEKDCGCHGEWDQLFGKGDKAKAREFRIMMKRSHILSRNQASAITQGGATAGPAVPRKNTAPIERNEKRLHVN